MTRVTVVNDTFTGVSGDVTGHAPDLGPSGLTWTQVQYSFGSTGLNGAGFLVPLDSNGGGAYLGNIPTDFSAGFFIEVVAVLGNPIIQSTVQLQCAGVSAQLNLGGGGGYSGAFSAAFPGTTQLIGTGSGPTFVSGESARIRLEVDSIAGTAVLYKNGVSVGTASGITAAFVAGMCSLTLVPSISYTGGSTPTKIDQVTIGGSGYVAPTAFWTSLRAAREVI